MIRPLLALLVLLWASPAAGQLARVIAPAGEPLRASPGGNVLAVIARGTRLHVGSPQDGWRPARLEGWIALSAVRDHGVDVAVKASTGDSLRATAGGAPVARIPVGIFLQRIGTQGDWIQVRRRGWVRDGSVRVETDAGGRSSAGGAASSPRKAGTDGSARRGSAASSARKGGAAAAPADTPTARAGGTGAALLARPGADTLAQLPPFASVEVLGRQGGWTRVRVEGWVPSASLAGPADSAGVISDLTAATLMANPDTYRGRVLSWSLQFIALRTAEPMRTDFHPGERFLLARGPGDEPGFVYIAVPPALLAAAGRLRPLQRIRVLARVREARSPLMGAPVLELIDLR